MTTPCIDNPAPFDLAIEYQERRGYRFRAAVSECQTICARCPVWQACLRDNRGADGVIAGLTIYERVPRKPPTERKGCGKPYGASAHYKAGENACDPCKAAQAKRMRERKRAVA